MSHQDGTTLDNDSLKAMLTNMGYAPTDLSKGYLIAIKRDSWTYNMQLVLSADQSKIGRSGSAKFIRSWK